MKRVRVVNPDGMPHHTRLYDVDTGEEIRDVVSVSIEQVAGAPLMVRYTVFAQVAILDLVAAERPH